MGIIETRLEQFVRPQTGRSDIFAASEKFIDRFAVVLDEDRFAVVSDRDRFAVVSDSERESV